MKVKQLIKKLQKLPQNAVVVVSSDPEGNCYSELYELCYDPKTYWVEEDAYMFELSPQEKRKKKAKPAVVLYRG